MLMLPIFNMEKRYDIGSNFSDANLYTISPAQTSG